MTEQSMFKIKNIRLTDSRTCELYMQHNDTASVKGWVIQCNAALSNQFHEHLNQLCQSENPFIALLQLKQFHKVEVLC